MNYVWDKRYQIAIYHPPIEHGPFEGRTRTIFMIGDGTDRDAAEETYEYVANIISPTTYAYAVELRIQIKEEWIQALTSELHNPSYKE